MKIKLSLIIPLTSLYGVLVYVQTVQAQGGDFQRVPPQPPFQFPDNTKMTDVRMHLPVGDTMTAVLTGSQGVIKNPNGTTPTFTGTVSKDSDGISFFAPIAVGTGRDRQTVTDIDQKHTHQGIKDGTLQIGAFQNAPGPHIAGLLTFNDFLEANGFNSPTRLSVPDFVDTANQPLFYGVDASIWASNQSTWSVGQTYDITGGVSSNFSGFLFSTTPLAESSSGWTTTAPYTGTALLDAFHDFASVPEPLSLIEAGTATVIALAYAAWRRRNTNRVREGTAG